MEKYRGKKKKKKGKKNRSTGAAVLHKRQFLIGMMKMYSKKTQKNKLIFTRDITQKTDVQSETH